MLATLVFVASGAGVFIRADWWRPRLGVSAVLSEVTIFLFWDGGMQLLVEKGLIGLLIDAAILITLLLIKGPSAVL